MHVSLVAIGTLGFQNISAHIYIAFLTNSKL